MKTLSLLFAMCMLPLSAVGADEPLPVAEPAIELSTDELMAGNALQKLAAALSSVNNREAADAVVPAIIGYCAGLTALANGDEPQWNFTPSPMSAEQAEEAKQAAFGQAERLKGESYYGSEALAEAMGDKAEDAVLPTSEQLTTLKLVAEKLRELNSIFQQVQDRATADAAAASARAILETLPGIASNVELPRSTLQASLLLVGMYADEQREIIDVEDRLRREYFYGSVALARALGQPEFAATLPATPTEAELAEMSAEIQAAYAADSDMQALATGGPGFTRETAWVISEQSSDAVDIEYQLMYLMPHSLVKKQQALMPGEDGRYFDRHVVDYLYNGKIYRLELWFDITAYFRAQYGERK